jgi:hypothetical protein
MLAVADPAGPNCVSFNRVSVLRTRNVLAPRDVVRLTILVLSFCVTRYDGTDRLGAVGGTELVSGYGTETVATVR